MAADTSKFVWRADGKQDGFLYTKAALTERESGSRWRRRQTRRTEPKPAERRKRTDRRHGVGVASALEAEIKRRCQPGFFVPCRYMLPCQQYMELYQRRSEEEHVRPHANTKGCQRRSNAAGTACGCRSGHPDTCGVWEYGDCSVCDPHSARFGDEDATVREDNLVSGQTSGRGRAEGDQEDTNGANASSRSRRGSESTWLPSSQGQVHINVDKPAGGNDDSQAPEDDERSPGNQVLPSIFDDDSPFLTPRSPGRHRLSAVDRVTVANVPGTFGFSPELLEFPTGVPGRTGEHSIHGVPFSLTKVRVHVCQCELRRYGHLAAMNKYMASMQQTDFDRFFSLLLSCRRLEKNIESQNLQLELYEKGYGRTAVAEILGSSKACARTKAKGEPAGKVGAQGGKGGATKSPSSTITPLGNKTANIFQNGAQKAGAPLARPLLQTSQATQEPGKPPSLKTPQGPVIRSENPIVNTKVPLTNTSATLPTLKTKVPLTSASATLPTLKAKAPLTSVSATLPTPKTKVPLTSTSAKLPAMKTKVPLTNTSAKLPVSAAGGTSVKSGVGAKPKIPLCKKLGKVSEG